LGEPGRRRVPASPAWPPGRRHRVVLGTVTRAFTVSAFPQPLETRGPEGCCRRSPGRTGRWQTAFWRSRDIAASNQVRLSGPPSSPRRASSTSTPRASVNLTHSGPRRCRTPMRATRATAARSVLRRLISMVPGRRPTAGHRWNSPATVDPRSGQDTLSLDPSGGWRHIIVPADQSARDDNVADIRSSRRVAVSVQSSNDERDQSNHWHVPEWEDQPSVRTDDRTRGGQAVSRILSRPSRIRSSPNSNSV
jgi:hypothetical protein